jgi:PDZ domain-containing protein
MTESETRAEPAPDDLAPPRRNRSGRVLLGSVVLVLLVAIVGSYIKVPYVIFSPGSATPVDDYVTVKGVKRYDHKGEVLLLTVSVSNGRPNLWRFVQAKLDHDSRIMGEQDYFGDVPRGKAEQQSVQMMTESQLAAKQAALTKLGYDVQVTGTGARVVQVVKGSPAARGGIKAGDVIVAVDGAPVTVRDQLGTIVQSRPVGTTFTITIQRDGGTEDLTVTSGTAPSGELEGKPYLGVGTVTENLAVKFPVDVRIDAGDVSGPSGGLAFALTIIDDLTPGDLTGGTKVAVTGEIDGSGNVGEVGGVPQKAVAARDAGARLMIVPKREVADARTRAGSMKVVGVENLDGALRVLRRNGGAPLALPAA